MVYVNLYTAPLVFRGVAYPPGATIPEAVDPEQLRYFAANGIVAPTTAPAPEAASAPGHVSPPLTEEVPDGDDGSE